MTREPEAPSARLEGSCACGAVGLKIDLSKPLGEVELRACGCSLCRRHAAKTFSDPQGSAQLTSIPGALVRYRFGLETADFLICRSCGVYVGAMTSSVEGNLSSTLNAQGLDLKPLLASSKAIPVSYEGESKSERMQRRLVLWTPTSLLLSSA
jgi:hypothetical protein